MHDSDAVSCMLAAYRDLRGFYRYWFSIFKLESFVFTKFVKHDRRKVHRQRDGVFIPENDPDNEYTLGSMHPPCPERPPVDRTEFMCLIDVCPKLCFLGTFGWHECNVPSTRSQMILRLPKKKTPWKLDSDDRSLAWGLECSFEISAVRVILWHLTIAIACFWVWNRLGTIQPTIAHNSVIPFTLTMVAISAFWAGAGILQPYEHRMKALSREYGPVQAHGSYIHQGDVFNTTMTTGMAVNIPIEDFRPSQTLAMPARVKEDDRD